MTHLAAVQGRIESVVARYRGSHEHPSQQEIDDLYTDACAAVLNLEAERLRVKRQLAAAGAGGATDDEAAGEAADVERLRRGIEDELDALRDLVRLLHTAVDWAHSAVSESTSVHETERFRRSV